MKRYATDEDTAEPNMPTESSPPPAAARPDVGLDVTARLRQVLLGGYETSSSGLSRAPSASGLEVAVARPKEGGKDAAGDSAQGRLIVSGGSIGGAVTQTRSEGKGGMNDSSTTSARVDQNGVTMGHNRALVGNDKDEPFAGMGGSATVAVTEHGAAVSGTAGVTLGGAIFSKGGGYAVEAQVEQPPRGQDGPWRVHWSRRTDESGTIGVKRGRAASAGMQAGKTESHTEHGVMVFAREAQARDFAEQGAEMISLMSPPARDAGTALTMAVGEVRGEASSEGTTAGASGSAGVANLAASGSLTSRKGYDVARVDATTFHVSISVGELRAGQVTTGVPLVAFGVTGSVDENETITVAVDLTTPEGRRQYEDLVDHGKLARGARVVSRSWRQTERDGQKMELPLASSSVESVVERQVVQADGHKVESAKGSEVEGHSIGVFGHEFAHHNADAGMRVIEKDDAEQSYHVEAGIDSTDGRLSHEALARATGTFTNGARPRKASGRWSIGAEVAEADMEAFMEVATSDHFRRGELGTRAGVADDLAEALKAAKSSDERREALARFTADGGPEALELIEHRIGEARGEPGFHFEHDLTLAGDKNFTGTAGRRELEGAIAGLRARAQAAGQDPAKLREVIAACDRVESQQSGRRTAISDAERYTDLPDQLRAREVARADGALAQVTTLRRDAEIAVVQASPEMSAVVDDERDLAAVEEQYQFYVRQLANPRGEAPRGHWVHSQETEALVRQARVLHQSAVAMRGPIDGARRAVVAGHADVGQLRAQLEQARQLHDRAAALQFAAVEHQDADSGVLPADDPPASPAPAAKRKGRRRR